MKQIICALILFAGILMASPIYTLSPTPAELASGSAPGFLSNYGAQAQANGDILRLDHSGNGYIEITDERLKAATSGVVEFSAQMRLGAPATPDDCSLLLAMGFRGYVADGGIHFYEDLVEALGEMASYPRGDWLAFRVRFDIASGIFVVYLDDEPILRCQGRRIPSCDYLFYFGDGSSRCSGSVELRDIAISLLEDTPLPEKLPDTSALIEPLRRELELTASGKHVSLRALQRFAPSFKYAGRPFSTATFDDCTRSVFPAGQKYTLTRLSADKRLRYTLEVKLYDDFPVVEWLPWLENVGVDDTPFISDFQSLNYLGQVPSETPVLFERNLGSQARHDDYMRADTILHSRLNTSLEMCCTEGRSSADWLPFFGVKAAGRFYHHLAIGWSGAWKFSAALQHGALTMQCGLRRTNFILHPGERIRQASFFIMEHDVEATEDNAHNRFRRFMVAHHSPYDSRGQLIKAPLSFSCGGGTPPDYLMEMLDFLAKERIPVEMLWMDAGWYGKDHPVERPAKVHSSVGGMGNETLGNWRPHSGNWRVNRQLHPQGLKPYADKARAMGMGFLLWFELERVSPAAPLYTEHPEWLLSLAGSADKVLDLGKPAAVDWTLAQLKARMDEDGVTAIRIDFNINTLPFWDAADAPERVGLTETRYVMGLYDLFDRIRAMSPDAAIDNCASGGRRNDFESLSRAFPLWRIDGTQTPESHQLQVSELSRWMPQHAAGLYGYDINIGDDYAMLSLCATATQISYFADQMEQNPQWLRDVCAKILSLRELFLQNYYHLTPPLDVLDMTAIHALQCDSLDHSRGCVVVFRRMGADDCATLQLRHVEPQAQYEVTVDGKSSMMSGAELQAYRYSLPTERSMAMLFYKRAK